MSIQPDNMSTGFLSGGGEMGALIRRKNWSKTPVGPVSCWPQSLRTALGILLDSGYAMYIAWGEEFTQFYNDAYRPILGSTKHPAALGQKASECFREIWDFIGPMFRRVLQQGSNTTLVDQLLPLDRHGYVEECYFTFSYSAIRDESAGVGGVFVTVIETTERVIGERRLRTLRELAANAVEAKDSGAAFGRSIQTLAGNAHDVPFALLYLVDEPARRAVLKETTANSPESPAGIDLDQDDAVWPLAAAAECGRPVFVNDVGRRIGRVIGPVWPEPVASAVVLPILQPGHTQAAGFIVAGLNPRHALDESYESYFDLIAGHITTALANAHAYEDEKRKTEALAELDRVKTAFFSNVSHEFRTPLTLLLGPLEEAIAELDEKSPGQRKRLEVAHRNGLRLLKLVNSLLDFSRIEAGRMKAVYRPTDLARFTAELAGVFRSAVEKAGLSLIVDCPPLAEPVHVDRDLWEKLVLNLLSNAFKFTFEGAITVALKPHGDHVELSVSDTGTGIPETELPYIFERFHRVEGARGRTHEGTGIGLALVQELVKLHGGRVRAESVYGKGSKFTVSIPLTEPRPEGSERHARTSPETQPPLQQNVLRADAFVEEAFRWLPDEESLEPSSEPSSWTLPAGQNVIALPRSRVEREQVPGEHPQETVLLADDNADMRQYVAGILATRYLVETAPDGQTALMLARETPPDLILTDIMMPVLDGFELLRALRSDPATSDIPVILLSARAGEESTVEGMEAGADDYLIKPFSSRELLARVGAHIKIARVRRQAARRIRESQEKFRLLVESAKDFAIVGIDPQGMISEWNFGAERLLGYPEAEILGQPAALIFTPEDRAKGAPEEELTGARLYGQASDERWHIRKDGSRFWGSGMMTSIQDEHGLLIGFVKIFHDRTTERLVEQTMRLSEERFRSAFAHAAIGMGLTDLQGRFIEVNDACCKITGYSKSELLKMDTQAIVHPDDWPESLSSIKKLISGEIPTFVIEKRYVRKDGGIVPVRNSVSLLRGSSGEPAHLITIVEDITDRARAEIAMRESGERLRVATTAAQLGIFEWRIPSNQAVWENERMYEIFGHSDDDGASGQSQLFGSVLHPADKAAVQSALAEGRKRGTVAPTVFRIIRKDKTMRWLEFSGSFEFLPNGTPLRLIGVVADITGRKQIEQAARESQERLRMALETARLGTWELELDTGVLECSPLCAAIFGIPPETPVTYGELQSIIHPDDRDRRDAAVRKALTDGTSYEAEYRVLFPDGSVHWVIGTGRGIYGDDGKPVRMVALTMDVTERKQAEENLHRTNAELRRANEDLNQFAFSASHDLQEPLRTVAIYSQLLRKKYVTRLDSQADGYIENVVQGAQRMEMLLKDLLAYTQIADTAEEPSESIDTAETIRTVLLNLSASIEESGASVQTGNLPYVRVHEIHLLQLFQNLVSNAIKYRSEDPPRICISAVPHEQRWLFSVEDNGLGIDPDHQKLVFGIFKRLHGQRYPGTGIGLAICQRIVERYGGQIWIDSAPGKGSTFHFTLPA